MTREAFDQSFSEEREPRKESRATEQQSPLATLTPHDIVRELDHFIVAQDKAKRAVAVALRNRWRRLQVEDHMREEITPKNIIMIGPTGVGKTEISRRLAKLAGAPFVKVEASKFTEVGYVGRDVESIIRDLVEVSVNLVREEQRERVSEEAEKETEERILDLLLPGSRDEGDSPASLSVFLQDEQGQAHEETVPFPQGRAKTREKLRSLLRAGKLESREVEFEVTKQTVAHMQMLGPQGLSEIEGQIKDMFSNMVPPRKEKKRLPVSAARKLLQQESEEDLIDEEKVVELALVRAQESGIVFIDEIDKVCGQSANQKGPDVSREGVQRDLLPLVEGCSVSTKYGTIVTDHVLFIASGAFHISKPSDLMPEFQGRFPIRVELESLTPEHFHRILTEPRNALTKQYSALMATEDVSLDFTDESLRELAQLTAEVNSRTENIGARRLYTILEKLLEDLSFSADQMSGSKVTIDLEYVREKLSDLVQDRDLSKYIL
ncbi:MAG: ATP-dependent protease ATPase subunit HslU [Bdellovibrionales bacterium]|nr:ATP-dependent protease ATPase subunit HslU [Bdellovibrionales bacterium]